MESINQLWVDHHVAIIAGALWILSGIINVLTRFKTPEEWIAFGERYPRLQNLIRLLRSLGVDPVKLVKVLIEIVTRKAVETSAERPANLKGSEKP